MEQQTFDFGAAREDWAKQRGMVTAAAAGTRDLDIARQLAWDCYHQTGRPVSIEDVRQAATRLELHLDFTRNWVGSVFKGWHWAGSLRASHEGSHSRRVGRWVPRQHLARVVN